MLKILPGYDGEPRICELVRSQITDITVKGAWTSPARLQLFEHALAPLTDLPVREVIRGSHILTDLTLGRDEVVFDYLAGRPQP
jgi:acetoacetate decarboxylase